MEADREQAALKDSLASVPARLRDLLDARGLWEGARFAVPTGTRVDVGSWVCGGRVWLVGRDADVVLAAAGKRPLVESLPRGELAESLYNHVTEALVFAPRKASVPHVRVPPATAYTLLDMLGAPKDARREKYGT